MRKTASDILSELKENPRLRLGAWSIIGIAWLYGLLVISDSLAPQREKLFQLQQKIDRLRPFEKADQLWQQRSAEARKQRAALEILVWETRSRSLSEAMFRDWLQTRAQAAGIKIRELTVRGVDTHLASASSTEKLTIPSLPDGYLLLRGKMSAPFSNQELASFLLLLHEHAKYVGIDRLLLRNPAPGQESSMEIELHAVFAIRENRP